MLLKGCQVNYGQVICGRVICGRVICGRGKVALMLAISNSAITDWATNDNCHVTVESEKVFAGKRSQQKVTISCLVLLAVFLLCWLPDQLYFFLYTVKPFKISLEMDTPLYHLVVILGLVNSVLNPFLYAFINPSYSAAFRNLVKKPEDRQEVHTTTNFSASTRV